MAALPEFSKMWGAYPGGTSEEAKAEIGGNVNLGWVTNTCVIRVSRALNAAGHMIPSNYPGLSTARGGDGLRYAYRVSEFKDYMYREFGAPSTSVAGGSAGAFGGQQGIICFDVAIWSDATGHFDLWDGGGCAHKAYFDLASQVMLWAC